MTQPTEPHGAALHIIDQASPQSSATTLARIADRGEPALLLGGTALRRRAAAAGLDPDRCDFLPVPAGHAGWGVAALRRWFAARPAAAAYPPIHAWSLSVLGALRWIGRGRGLTLELTQHPDARAMAALGRRPPADLKVHTLGEHLRRQLIDAGFPAAQTAAVPLLDLQDARAKIDPARLALRDAWAVPDDAAVVALLSDPYTEADIAPAARVIDFIGHAAGRKLYLLVHPLQSGRRRLQILLDRYREADRVLQDARLAAPWQVLAGCDAALLGTAPAPLAARYAAAAGLPIVAPDLPAHREALADAPRVFFAADAEPKRLAHRLQHGALGFPAVPRVVPADT